MTKEQKYDLKDLMKVLLGNDIKEFNGFIEQYGINCIEKKDKRNLLMYCVLQKKNDYSKKLIESGINLNHQDSNGYSVLHYAVQENNLEIVTLLIKNKIEIDMVDKNGNSSLWRASYDRKKIDKRIIEKLINAGADIHKKNNYGIAPEKYLEDMK